jgi:outer membrane protein
MKVVRRISPMNVTYRRIIALAVAAGFFGFALTGAWAQSAPGGQPAPATPVLKGLSPMTPGIEPAQGESFPGTLPAAGQPSPSAGPAATPPARRVTAPSASGFNLAVVDITALVQNSSAGKSARAQIDKARASYQKSLTADQAEVRKLEDGLAAQRATLSPDAYQKRVQDLQKKIAGYQRQIQERQGKLAAASNTGAQQIGAAVERIVAEIGKERNYALVLNKAGIIGGPGIVDITPEVLPRLNQRLASVKLDLPK